jgi:hypothetical protein
METSELAGADGSYATLAADRLRRQRSFPCAGGGEARRKLGTARLGGGKVGHRDGHDGEGVEFGGGFVRVLWMQVVGKVVSRSRSRSSSKKQYGHVDYAENFDEGAAAGEPDNLPRSFSARYARHGKLNGKLGGAPKKRATRPATYMQYDTAARTSGARVFFQRRAAKGFRPCT